MSKYYQNYHFFYTDIKTKYPSILREISEFDVKEGWFDLVADMLKEINLIANVNPEKDIKIVQIKQKLGELRVYVNGIINGSITYNIPDISDIIKKYVNIASITCEDCGYEGRLEESDDWLHVSCSKCI